MSDGGQQAFVPDFDYDVFISYAWVNNYPEQEDKPESGWVTRFKTKLQQRIDERLGRTGATRLFFDRVRLGKNQDFDAQIETAVQKSAVFVAMFSEGYIQSPGCRAEITAFNKAVGGALAQSGRLFLVPIDEVDPKTWPAEFHDYLQRIIGYEFYLPDPVNQLPTRVRHDHAHFQVRLEELRTSLAKKLKEMKAEKPSSPGASPTTVPAAINPTQPAESRPTVLVAQSTADLRKQRKALITYCESAELNVLGAAPYPAAADQFRKAFLADLGQSHLFVQLLSDCYSDRTGEFPEGKELWQLAEARQAGVSILQWRDASLDLDEIDDQRHRQLVTHPDVRTDPPASFHKDLVERTRRAFDVGKTPVELGEKRFALVKFSHADEQPTRAMVDSLKQANVVCRATHNGRPMVDRLREIPFDALVVVLGKCPADWREDRGDELLAVELNFKDQAPLRAYYFCESDTIVPPFVGQEVLEIRGPSELDRLVQAIQGNGGAS